MDRLTTYTRMPAIGQMSRPTPEQRTREGDRWVALRTLVRRPTFIQEAPDAPTQEPLLAPAAARRPVLYESVLQRHLDARRRMGG